MLKKLFYLSVVLLFFSCDEELESGEYRQEMRNFVIGISEYAKDSIPDFVVIPQNGIELVSDNGEEDGVGNAEYLNAIDGNGQEDLFYGYDDDNESTPADERNYMCKFLDKSKAAGNTILVTDYCWTTSKMQNSYSVNAEKGYISFAADSRELNQIPAYPAPINNSNSDDIVALSQVKNFLYLINPEKYASKQAFITAMKATDYDLIIMDLFLEDEEFSAEEINQLKVKNNGAQRMVVCYMSIGEAEDYRYYWKSSWDKDEPEWLDDENKDWEGNYKVRYWMPEWQSIIYGNDDSYLDKILAAGFDGVYLDIIEAFEYYE